MKRINIDKRTVVITDDIVKGLGFVGPFPDKETAEEWASKYAGKYTTAQIERPFLGHFVNHVINEVEVANIIYDELMQNVGMSPEHIPFPIEDVSDHWVEKNVVMLRIKSHMYKITVEEIVD